MIRSNINSEPFPFISGFRNTCIHHSPHKELQTNSLVVRPFRRRFIRFSHLWNSKLSLVDVFSTFLLLSYYTKNFSPVMLHVLISVYICIDGIQELCCFTILNYYFFIPTIFLSIKSRLFTNFLFSYVCTTFHHLWIYFMSSSKDSTSGGVDLQFVYSFYLILRVMLLLIFVGCNGAPFKNCSQVFIFLCVHFVIIFCFCSPI